MHHDPDSVLRFWFEELTEKDWFGSGGEVDARIRERFAATHAAVAAGETFDWRTSATGRLAEVIVLDQFSRNMFRGTGKAFAFDAIALVLAQEAVACGADQQLPAARRTFLYMPYMHSESPIVHEAALRLFTALGDQNALAYERMHFDVIKRFGRYPRRNAALGRESTAEEREYMATNKGPV